MTLLFAQEWELSDVGIKGGDDRLNVCIKNHTFFSFSLENAIFLTVALRAVVIYAMPNNRLTPYPAVYVARQQKK